VGPTCQENKKKEKKKREGAGWVGPLATGLVWFQAGQVGCLPFFCSELLFFTISVFFYNFFI
jgi:hypothetical protein